MDPGLSTSPNQCPDLGLSIAGIGFSVKRFIDFRKAIRSHPIYFLCDNFTFSWALLRRLFPCEPATEKPSLEQGDDNKENVRENDEQE